MYALGELREKDLAHASSRYQRGSQFAAQKRRGASQLARVGFILVCLGTLPSCALHYYDPKTGAEHVWGVGHIAMKVTPPKDGHQAAVRGTDLLGVSAGQADEGLYLSLGWDHRRHVEILDPNTAVGLEWPSGDFFNVRVGSTLPHLPQVSDGK